MQGELTKYQKEFLAMCDIFNRCKFAPEEYSQDYHCFPICASREQLHGLPPAVVTACEDDLLRFQDIEFARMLMEAGVETTFRLFEGSRSWIYGRFILYAGSRRMPSDDDNGT